MTKPDDLRSALALFTGGTSKHDESTVRRSHDERLVHFYTGSQTVARQLLTRLLARPEDVVSFEVHHLNDPKHGSVVDGLSVTVKAEAVRGFAMMVKAPKREVAQ
jgi:hypothetical protein